MLLLIENLTDAVIFGCALLQQTARIFGNFANEKLSLNRN